MDTSIGEGKEVRVRVGDMLGRSEFENLFQVENAPGSHFSRITVWRWMNKPETVFRISVYALYKFLRSLGHTHGEIEEMKLSDVFELGRYRKEFEQGL